MSPGQRAPGWGPVGSSESPYTMGLDSHSVSGGSVGEGAEGLPGFQRALRSRRRLCPWKLSLLEHTLAQLLVVNHL